MLLNMKNDMKNDVENMYLGVPLGSSASQILQLSFFTTPQAAGLSWGSQKDAFGFNTPCKSHKVQRVSGGGG